MPARLRCCRHSFIANLCGCDAFNEYTSTEAGFVSTTRFVGLEGNANDLAITAAAFTFLAIILLDRNYVLKAAMALFCVYATQLSASCTGLVACLVLAVLFAIYPLVYMLAVRRLAYKHPRYGYRFITAKVRQEGWLVNKKRIQRLWQKEGLQVPHQPKTKISQGGSENACYLKKAAFINHVWMYDLIGDQPQDGRAFKFLTVLDEYTRELLTIEADRSIRTKAVIAVPEYLFEVRDVPKFIRSDNGTEFIAQAIKEWLSRRSVDPLYIEPGSPWENGYAESFHGRFRDELLDREVFHSVREARVLAEGWWLDYNDHRPPHNSLGYKTPAQFVAERIASATPSPRQYTGENVENSLIVAGT